MMIAIRIARAAAALIAVAGTASAQTPPYLPATHNGPPPLLQTVSPPEFAALADQGLSIERDRSAVRSLAEHRRLAAALATLEPQRKGVVDAYVVSVALDSDPVFGREAREAGRVLTRRYAAAGRSIVLAGTDGTADSTLPMGSPDALATVLARVAELMDPREDVLVLYTTSHGAPFGIVYNDADQGFGAISPARLWSLLSTLDIQNRLILVSACYAGVFVPMLRSQTTAIVTAASSERTSFGCQADNDWTFFGDALVNHALRRRQPLARAAAEAQASIAGWEARDGLIPSEPQVDIGAGAARWLAALESHLPPASAPVGRPATDSLRAR